MQNKYCKSLSAREKKLSMIQFHWGPVLIKNRKLGGFSGNKHFMRDLSIHSAANVLRLFFFFLSFKLFSWLVCFPTLVLLFGCSVALD